MDVKTLVDISQIATAPLTLAGLGISIYLSYKALKEVHVDRQLNNKPFLLFETGPTRLPVELVKMGKTIPGINADYVKATFAHIPDDIESIRVKGTEPYGKLKNYGNGPAIDVDVTFIPKEFWIGIEKFKINSKKIKEPQYGRELNKLPVHPSHIIKGEIGQLIRIPTFIEKDFEKKISRIDGEMEIAYKDIFLNQQKTKQGFRIFTNYDNINNYIQFVFIDIIDDNNKFDQKLD